MKKQVCLYTEQRPERTGRAIDLIDSGRAIGIDLIDSGKAYVGDCCNDCSLFTFLCFCILQRGTVSSLTLPEGPAER